MFVQLGELKIPSHVLQQVIPESGQVSFTCIFLPEEADLLSNLKAMHGKICRLRWGDSKGNSRNDLVKVERLVIEDIQNSNAAAKRVHVITKIIG